MSPLRRIASTSRLALLAVLLSAPIALVPYVLHSPGLDGAIGLPGLKEFAGAVRAALPSIPPVHHPSAAHAAAPPAARPVTVVVRRPPATAHTAAPAPGRRLQSVVTASCAGCTVAKDSGSGALRATISRSAGRHGSAYAVVDMGTKSSTLTVHDRLALGAGQVPAHDVDVLQVTDTNNRLVYRLVVAARTRLLSFVSPPGALAAAGIAAGTGTPVPNDGRGELDVRVVTRTNGFVTVAVNGQTVVTRTGLAGGAAGEQRYVAAGVIHATQGGAPLTVVHDSLSIQAAAPATAQPAVVVSTAALPIAAQPAPPPPPANLTPPAVTGTPYDGSTLTVDTGTWSGADSLAIRWSACAADGTGCTTIPDATDATYTPGPDDVGSALRATVTATNGQGSAPASSPLTVVVAGASPVLLTAPTVGGTAIQGGTLKFVPGTWKWKTGNSTYKWQRCDATGASCGTIDAPPTAPYTLTAGDVGGTFRLLVTAPGYRGSTTIATATTVVVVPATPVSSAAPTVSGSAVVGATLTAAAGTWSDPQPTLTYAWSRCAADGSTCAPITGATAPTYTVSGADVGSTLLVTVTGANVTGSVSVPSAATAVVPVPPAATTAPSISGDAVSGSTLTAALGAWSDPTVALGVAWLRCDSTGACAPIDGATAGTYTLTDADVGSTIEVVVTATGATGSATATSAATGTVAPKPAPPAPTLSTPPAITGDATVGSTLTAGPGTWSDPLAALGVAWERCDAAATTCTPIDGATGTTYVVTPDDLGATLEIAVTATNAGGSGSATSGPTGVVTAPAAAPTTDAASTPAASAPAADGSGPATAGPEPDHQ